VKGRVARPETELICHVVFLQRVSRACYAEHCTVYTVLAIVNPSVCTSVRPSHAGIVS